MAVGDKIQLAFKSEVVAISNTVNNLNTTVNDNTTGLAGRVANLEAGGGAGMTPQQVADLAACVTDKHAHTNKAVLDGISAEFVTIVNNLNTTVNEPVNGLTDRVTALEPDKHNHDNKSVLDLITAAFTTAEKTKLGNLTDNFKGLFADAAARNTGVTNPVSGNYVLQQDTDTVWYFNGATWINTGAATTGDMLKAVYDPTGIESDVFSMDNMVETETKKILTDVERDKLKLYRGHVTDEDGMLALGAPATGHFCSRNDTSSIWLYNGASWNNTNNIDKLIESPTKKVMTNLERDKLALYRGHVTNNTAMLALTSPVVGNYCTRDDTKSVWVYVGTSWVNTIDLDNLVETSTKKVMTNVERDKLALYRGHVADNAAMVALTAPANGHYCTRADTKSVWLYSGGSWSNTSAPPSWLGATMYRNHNSSFSVPNATDFRIPFNIDGASARFKGTTGLTVTTTTNAGDTYTNNTGSSITLSITYVVFAPAMTAGIRLYSGVVVSGSSTWFGYVLTPAVSGVTNVLSGSTTIVLQNGEGFSIMCTQNSGSAATFNAGSHLTITRIG